MNDLLRLLTSFRGRISRRQWWIGFVIVCVGNVVGGLLLNPDFFLADELPPPSWPDTLWQIAMLYPATAITVKRFNDRDWPAWLGYAFAPIGAVLYLAPHLGQAIGPQSPAILMVLFWAFAAYLVFAFVDNGFVRGAVGLNRYGPDPLAASAQPA
jgi:uncharacterized membrane protein YhaH (DUF805 family)